MSESNGQKPQDETPEYWFSQHTNLDREKVINLFLVKVHRNPRAKFILNACLTGLELKTLRDAFTQMKVAHGHNS